MKENQKDLEEEKNISKDDKSEDDLFLYEVSSTNAKLEVIEELPANDDLERFDEQTLKDEEDLPPISHKKTIRIISEKDMEIKENPPPNYSPYFVCALHFKNQPYKKRKLLTIKQVNDD